MPRIPPQTPPIIPPIAAGDVLPAVQPRIIDREMNDDAPRRVLDPSSQFEQSFAECSHLDRGQSRASGASADLLHQNVGGSCHQDAQLIGQEAGATGPVNFQTVMQFLDPVFCISPAAVDFVDGLGVCRGGS